MQEIIIDAQHNKLEPEPGMTLRESFEHNVSRVLNQARDTAGRSAEMSLKDLNNVKQMVTSGLKVRLLIFLKCLRVLVNKLSKVKEFHSGLVIVLCHILQKMIIHLNLKVLLKILI